MRGGVSLYVSARAARYPQGRAEPRSARRDPLFRAALDRAVPLALFSRLLAGVASGDARARCAGWSSIASASISPSRSRPGPERCCARAAGSRRSARRGEKTPACATPRRCWPYGVVFERLNRERVLAELEPHLSRAAIGGVHFTDPLTTPDPQALARSYADLFVAARRTGRPGRRAHARGVGRRLDRDIAGGAGRRARGRHRAGAVVGRTRRGARLPSPVRRQARLPHALCAARQCRASAGRCSISRRATS